MEQSPSQHGTILRDSSPTDAENDNHGGAADKDKESFHHSKIFAQKEYWSRFFPQIAYDDTKERKRRKIILSKRSRTLLLQVGVVGSILTTNFALTVFASTHFHGSKGATVIYQGNCVTVNQLDTYIHLLINLLSTGMLMASNYCMQLQAAPTRKNIDDAHKNGYWLDIGVPSLRNFWWISKSRKLCWILLAVSSVPVHLIYNSAVFQSLASNDYAVAVVTPSFLNGEGWNITAAETRGLLPGDGYTSWVANPTPGYGPSAGWKIPGLTPEDTIRAMQQNSSTTGMYLKMDASDCYTAYADYWAAYGNLVVVAKHQSVQSNDSLLIFASVIPRSDNWAKNGWAQASAFEGPDDGIIPNPWVLGPAEYEVDYCLVQPPATNDDRCQFEYSPQIMVIICVINFIKAFIMFVTWVMRTYQWEQPSNTGDDSEVIYTLGDAISSFMRKEDPHTKGMCLATRDDFVTRKSLKKKSSDQKPVSSKGSESFRNRFATHWRASAIRGLLVRIRNFKDRIAKKPPLLEDPRLWVNRSVGWWRAASFQRWAWLIGMCIILIAVAVGLLVAAFVPLQRRGIGITIPSFWSLGFGSLTPYTYIVIPNFPRADPNGLIANVMLANLPQFIVSFMYLFYNAMLSCFLVQREFTRMWTVRKPLRVSEPRGIQRSSYFISLPLRYGIPLYTTSGILHWLISQSLFLARITAFYPDGSVDEVSSFSTCGYSPIALFITTLVGIVLVLGLIGLGFRQYDGTMPLVSTSSLAISAACHPPEEDKAGGYLMPVIWGVTEIDANGVGHCTVTTAADILTLTEAHESGATVFM